MVINIFSILCHWLLIDQRSQDDSLDIEWCRFSNPGFPKTTDLMSIFKVSIQCFLQGWENLIKKSLNLYPSVECWWNRVARKRFQSWRNSIFKIYNFICTLTVFIHQDVNLNRFIRGSDCSFLDFSKLDLYFEIENLRNERSEKLF